MNDFWAGKRVCVTGGAGFIGGHVVVALTQRGVPRDRIATAHSRNIDLRDLNDCKLCMAGCQVVIHLAAPTGGIQYSSAHPASQYGDTMQIALNVFKAARVWGVEKLVGIGNILAYPANAPNPLEEWMLFDGPLANTHLGIGTAKRDLVSMCEMYHKEFGLNGVTGLAANAYGPGDRFDPAVAHVIPATIVKCHKNEPLIVWGDGSQTRDFLFVEDIAEGLLLAAEKIEPPPYHINLASGTEVSIRELVEMIARLCDFKGDIIFDKSKGGGDPRRVASGRMAREVLGFVPKVGMEEGLKRTIDWYRSTP